MSATLAEVREHWSLLDVVRANQVLDALDEKAHERELKGNNHGTA